MPSIRMTLKEMGVTPAQMFAELGLDLNNGASLCNGTAPTPLTNYLDVRRYSSSHFQSKLCRNIRNILVDIAAQEVDYSMYERLH